MLTDEETKEGLEALVGDAVEEEARVQVLNTGVQETRRIKEARVWCKCYHYTIRAC